MSLSHCKLICDGFSSSLISICWEIRLQLLSKKNEGFVDGFFLLYIIMSEIMELQFGWINFFSPSTATDVVNGKIILIYSVSDKKVLNWFCTLLNHILWKLFFIPFVAPFQLFSRNSFVDDISFSGSNFQVCINFIWYPTSISFSVFLLDQDL